MSPTAGREDTIGRKVRITHPFHPDSGRELWTPILSASALGRGYAGDDARLRTISTAFTDLVAADEFRLMAGGRAAFRTIDLMTLRELLVRLGTCRGPNDA